MASTQTWADASALLCDAVLEDTVSLYRVGPPVTSGIHVTRSLTPSALGIPGLVQTMSIPDARGGLGQSSYSIKVEPGTDLQVGMVVEVASCVQEPALVGAQLLVESVSRNGMALLIKGIAHAWQPVDLQGKP